jgi:hypothetical protein
LLLPPAQWTASVARVTETGMRAPLALMPAPKGDDDDEGGNGGAQGGRIFSKAEFLIKSRIFNSAFAVDDTRTQLLASSRAPLKQRALAKQVMF